VLLFAFISVFFVAPLYSNFMQVKREMEDAGHPHISKKRRSTSDAEKLAVEMSKIYNSLDFHSSVGKEKHEKSKVRCLVSARHFQHGQCTWRDSKANPCYCDMAKLHFEAFLPDRMYLTRFSVRCPTCYAHDFSTLQLYCSYCDEVLSGTIAAPGGKVSDHLITIRHVYQQALAFKDSLASCDVSVKMWAQARDYVSKFDEWSKLIRYPVRTSLNKTNIEAVLRELQSLVGPCGVPASPQVQLITAAIAATTPAIILTLLPPLPPLLGDLSDSPACTSAHRPAGPSRLAARGGLAATPSPRRRRPGPGPGSRPGSRPESRAGLALQLSGWPARSARETKGGR
jgi:hypothetical protein